MMPCPRCLTHLHGVRTPAGKVWDCPRGHGRFALLPVLRGLVRKAELDTAWKTAFWGRPHPGCRCPSCGRAMAEVDAAGFRLDVCRHCQALWLDHAEVRAMPAARREETIIAAQAADARKAMALAQVDALQRRHHEGEAIGGAPDELWKQAAGIFGLPVEIGAMGTRVRPWATWGLCAAILLISLALIFGDLQAAVFGWGFIPAESLRLAGLTWITAFFIHGGLGHLLGNLWFLWLTGDNVEDAIGWRRFLILVLAATAAGHVAHMLFDPRSTLPCVGASGGISGVLTAYAMRFPNAQIGLAWFWGRIWLRLPAWLWISLWIGGQLILVWQQVHGFTNVSALAHFGGVAAGAGLVWWWGRGAVEAGAASPGSTPS